MPLTPLDPTAALVVTDLQEGIAGFNVAPAVDAMADRGAEARENGVARVFPCIGETGTTTGIIALARKKRPG